jgi:DNA-binding NarL/FixJ family response regulator
VIQKEAFDPIDRSLSGGKGGATAKPASLTSEAMRPGRMYRRLPTSLAFIDPKSLTRHSIMHMLEKAFPGALAMGAASCEELFEIQGRTGDWPQLVIVYIRSAGVTDSWVQEELELVRLRLPDTLVIMLSDRDDAEEVVKALTFGVRGYIPTSVDWDVAFAALDLIHAGGTFIPAQALGSVSVELGAAGLTERSELPRELDLTDRELAVINLLREGRSNRLIAAQLKMQESTVKVHVRNILKKLHVVNRTQAASIANRLLGPQAQTPLGLPRPTSPAPEQA